MCTTGVALFVNVLSGQLKGQFSDYISPSMELAIALAKRYPGFIYATEKNIDVVEMLNEQLCMIKKSKIVTHYLNVKDHSSVNDFLDHIRSKFAGVDILVINCSKFVEYDMESSPSERVQHVFDRTYHEVRQLCNVLYPLLRSNARVIHLVDGSAYTKYIPGLVERMLFSDKAMNDQKLQTIINDYISDIKSGQDVSATWGNEVNIIAQNTISSLAFIQQRNFDKTNDNIAVNVVHLGYLDNDVTHGYGQPVLKMEQVIRFPLKLCLQPKTNAPCKGLFFWCNQKVVETYC